MAKLHERVDSDDELPELPALFQSGANIKPTTPYKNEHSKIGSSKSPRKHQDPNKDFIRGQTNFIPKSATKPLFSGKRAGDQRALSSAKSAYVNSLLLHKTNDSLNNARNGNDAKEPLEVGQKTRSSPRKLAKAPVDYSRFAASLSESSFSLSDGDESATDLSGFIVPDSASDDEVLLPRSRRSNRQNSSKRDAVRLQDVHATSPKSSTTGGPKGSRVTDLVSPAKKATSPESKIRQHESESSERYSDTDDPWSKLRFSPPRSKLPHKAQSGSRQNTPPQSPFKMILQSPSKKHRIPPSPYRPSVDAFWSQEVTNDWNEQYSPKKTLKSPRKFRYYLVDEDEDGISPSESPRRSPVRSPAKRDKEAVLRQKAFSDKKHEMATSFLAEVDQTIAGGQVSALAASTGGIKIVWSKKLTSTAGRANWRREAIRSKSPDGTIVTTTHRHHASIELAEKVIDDEDRLFNVIAHEYCHLANFMISEVKDNPHGREFKEWAKKCTKAFSHRNVTVTTKHAYTIAYKYIWVCTSCETEYKRHSKSIDPSKHTCGKCKSKLVQVQPAPRKGQGEGKRSEYQDFVKREHERVRLENPGKGFGERMAILGREFRERNKKSAVSELVGSEDVVREVEKEDEEDLDAVVRKLDFVHLDE